MSLFQRISIDWEFGDLNFGVILDGLSSAHLRAQTWAQPHTASTMIIHPHRNELVFFQGVPCLQRNKSTNPEHWPANEVSHLCTKCLLHAEDDRDIESPGPSSALISKPRRAPRNSGTNAPPYSQAELSHPLLGDQPTLKLMPDQDEVRGFHQNGASSTRRR